MLIEYLKDVKDIKDILKIRLHMWDVKKTMLSYRVPKH